MVFVNSIKHPNEFSAVSGRTQLVKEIESIEQSMRLLLLTEKGECFGDPELGSHLTSYLYQFSGEMLYQMIRDDIAQTITEQDSRVSVRSEDVQVVEEDETLRIVVPYRIKYANYESETTILVQKRKEEDY